MATTDNYHFKKKALGHPVRDDDIGANLDLIDTAIKDRESEKGSSNFGGESGVTITHNLNLTNYAVTIVQTDADPIGSVGEIWVTDVAANSFVVRNSGSAITSFTWITHNTT